MPKLQSLFYRAAGDRRGFALISILWGVALLSLIAAAVLAASATVRRSGHVALQQAQAESLAEAAINSAILSLLDPKVSNRPRLDGTPYVLTFAATQIKVSIQDEYGKIDLNTADGATLSKLFTSVGLTPEDAASISDKIQDWRESGAGKRLNGAAAADYQAAGYQYGPRRNPFQRVDELKLVMGVTADLFLKVAPALTVYSHQPTVELMTAPRETLLALSLPNGESVDQFISKRAGTESAASSTTPSANPTAAIDLTDRPCSIRVEVSLPAGGVYRREAVIRLTGNPQQPFLMQNWQEAWIG